MDLKVGDKVICVDSSPGNNRPSLLVEGKGYTITRIVYCFCGAYGVCVGLMERDFLIAKCKCGRVHSIGPQRQYKPTRFIKREIDKAIDGEIREALNEDIKVKN